MRIARLLVLAGLCGCWGSSSYFPIPASVVVDAPNNFTGGVPTGTAQVFVLGYYFSLETVIQWDGRPQKTTFVGTSAPGLTGVDPTLGPSTIAGVRVDLDADATKAARTSNVTASNGGGGISAPLEVAVVDAAFTFTAVSPAQSDLNAAAMTLTLTGTGFRADSVVFFDGTPLAVTFVSSTSVTAQVPAALLTNPGDRIVQAFQQPCSSTDPNVCARQLEAIAGQIVTVGPAGQRSVLNANPIDLVWDATHARLFAATQTSSSDIDFNLFPIDPTTGTAGSGVAIQAFEGFQMKASAGDQFLYVLQGDFEDVRRFSLPDLATVTVVPGNRLPEALAPSPDAAQTFAFAGGQSGVVDGTTQRSTLSPDIHQTATAATWGADGSTLYALADSLLIFHVDATGIVSTQAVPAAHFFTLSDLVFDRPSNRLYFSQGESYDAQGGDPRPFPLTAVVSTSPFTGFADCRIAIDSGLGKAFFACNEGARLTVRSFDLATRKFVARIVLATAPPTGDSSDPRSASPNRLVRWGASGLAVATSAGTYLYSGPFVH